jgi:(p)ppGpp synthase/HD superfamily hydrolase
VTVIEFLASVHGLPKDLRADMFQVLHLVAAHQGRALRDSGEFVLEHPCDVARQLMDLHFPHDVIVAGGLHDMIEDTTVTYEMIVEQFNEQVAMMVEAVSKKPKSQFPDKAARLEEFHNRFLTAAVANFNVVFIKFADRLHNLETLHGLERKDPLKVERIARETLAFYVPLATEGAKSFTPAKLHYVLDKYGAKMAKLADNSLVNIHANHHPTPAT